MYNSIPHFIDLAVPSVFLALILTSATCYSALSGHNNADRRPPEIEDFNKIQQDRQMLQLQQKEMLDKINNIKKQVNDNGE